MSLQVRVHVYGARVPARACTRAVDREEYCTSVIIMFQRAGVNRTTFTSVANRAKQNVRTEQVNEERA